MKRVLLAFIAFTMLSLPLAVFADEGPLALPAGANADANKHNAEGISHYGQGHYDVALKHFEAASKADPKSGEVHFNEAITLDKMGKHGDATMHFKGAQKNAGGNKAILDSAILNSHLGK